MNAHKVTKAHRLANALKVEPKPSSVSPNHRKLGVTAQRYDEILAAQGGGCAICGKSWRWDKKAHALDHDHTTGKVRGILCQHCNTGLGQFHDSVELLRRAIQYLIAHDVK